MNLLFFKLISLHSAPGYRFFLETPVKLGCDKEGDKKRKQAKIGRRRSRAQDGAGAACIVGFPPPPPVSTRPTYQVT